MDAVKRYIRITLNIVLPLTQICLICWLGPKILGFFMPFVIGWIIALIANPLVRFLESRVKILRKHSSMIIVAAALGIVIALLYFLISRLVNQVIGFTGDLPVIYEMLVGEVELLTAKYQHIFQLLPPAIQEFWIDFAGNVGEYFDLLVQRIASLTMEFAGNVAKRIPYAVVYFIITTLSSYFFIAERDKIMEFWSLHMPKRFTKYGLHMNRDVKQLVGVYFIVQFKIMIIIGLILWIGFLVLGVRYGFMLAILFAFLDFLPLLGTGTVLIPWALLETLAGNYPFAAGLALLYILTQVLRQIIQPKLVGDTMGLSPLLTLLLLYLGFRVRGISGMILAVPVGIFIINLYRYGFFDSLIENVRILIHDLDEFCRSK